MSDISITAIPSTSFPTLLLGAGTMVGYQLQPDGLTFNSPVTLTVDISEAPTSTFLAFLDGATPDTADVTDLTLSTDGSTITGLTASLEHFSYFFASRGTSAISGGANFVTSAPDVSVGQEFTMTLRVAVNYGMEFEQRTYADDGVIRYHFTGPEWMSGAGWTITGPISGGPGGVVGPDVSTGGFEDISRTFTCTGEGTYTILAYGRYWADADATYIPDGQTAVEKGTARVWGFSEHVVASGECLGPRCGDYIIQAGEQCDGQVPADKDTCGEHGRTPADEPVYCNYQDCTYDFFYCD